MAFRDLRHWIEILDRKKELARVRAKVDLDREIAYYAGGLSIGRPGFTF